MNTVAISAAFPGVSRVLEEGEKLGLWTFLHAGGQFLRGSEVILGAWHPEYQGLLDQMQSSMCRFTVLWTSSLGEMGLEPVEIEYFDQLLSDGRVKHIWVGDPALQGAHEKVFYAPYPMSLEGYEKGPKLPIMTLFCPQTAKKNILNQLQAAHRIQQITGGEPWIPESSLYLHTNVGIPRFIQVYARCSSWLRREEYDAVIRSSRLNLAVSFAETWNYQSAEAILMGTPVLGSPTIPFLPRKHVATDVNDAELIAQQALELLNDQGMVEEQEHALRDYVGRGKAQLVTALRDRGIIS